ncbi:hypothetical protein A3K71_05450 [archaeon RBG_16_50_20]|nr:MAG: hypothetical protein A3K71_05450 [archaeon RBG_16_50_20]
MNKISTLAILLVVVGLGGLVVGIPYSAYNVRPSYSNGSWQGQNQGMMGQWYQQPQTQSGTAITIELAKTIAQQYLASLGNSNLAIKEIMEFQSNFYIMYFEKDTGLGAFEMLIWKQTPPYEMMGPGFGMMGGLGFGFFAGLLGLIFGAIVIISAFMLNSKPQEHTTWGMLIVIFSVLSIFGSAMGGFGIGLVLGLIGGALAMAWKPPESRVEK